MKMIKLFGDVLKRISDFFAASWAYIKSSNATFGSLGDDLIASAQTDLINLKDKLDKLWVIKDEDKNTTVSYMAAMLGKLGFAFIIIVLSLMASLLKLIGGACCLLLAGKWLSLLSKLFNTLYETFTQSFTLLRSALRKFVTNALELCNKIAQKLGNYIGRFLNAALDFVRALTSYLSGAWRIMLDFVAAARRAIWQGIQAIRHFTRNFIRNFSSAIINCFNGVAHLALGTLNAGVIVTKGIVLSVAALFIETGIASSLSGVAKTMFILDESLAAGIGALMDGIYTSGSSFLKAAKSIFGYGFTAPEEISDEVDTDPILDDSTYFSRKAHDGMQDVNRCVAYFGNELLSAYYDQKSRMVSTSGWRSGCHEAVNLISRHRPKREAF